MPEIKYGAAIFDDLRITRIGEEVFQIAYQLRRIERLRLGHENASLRQNRNSPRAKVRAKPVITSVTLAFLFQVLARITPAPLRSCETSN